MHILAFQSGLHDASAAAFEDYRLGAGIAEERLRREKGWGNDIPWRAIDEVLQIAGWSREDVDAIATIHGIFPLHYFRFSQCGNSITRRGRCWDTSGSSAISRTSVPVTTHRTRRVFSAPTGSLPRTASLLRPKYYLPHITPPMRSPRSSTPTGTTR